MHLGNKIKEGRRKSRVHNYIVLLKLWGTQRILSHLTCVIGQCLCLFPYVNVGIVFGNEKRVVDLRRFFLKLDDIINITIFHVPIFLSPFILTVSSLHLWVDCLKFHQLCWIIHILFFM